MDPIEICVDRARLELPPEESKPLGESYIDVLEDLDHAAHVRKYYLLEVSRDAREILGDRRAFRLKAHAWKLRTGAVTPVDSIWELVRGILDRSRTVEDVHGVDIVVLNDRVDGLPEELQHLTREQVEDLAQIVAMVSEGARGDSSHSVADPCVVTCLPPARTVQASLHISADMVLENSQERNVCRNIDCLLVGGPQRRVDSIDPVQLWVGAKNDDDRLQAIELMVRKIALKVTGARLRKWSLGAEFVEIARKYKYLTEKTRASGLLEVMAYTILGEQRMGTPRPLYEDEKRKIVRVRGNDVGRHRDVGRDLRLNYWRCGDGSIEFGAACGQHDDQLLPR